MAQNTLAAPPLPALAPPQGTVGGLVPPTTAPTPKADPARAAATSFCEFRFSRPLELGDTGLKPPVRLDQFADPQQQRDRRLPVAIEDRLRLGTLHAARVRRPRRVPPYLSVKGGERLRLLCEGGAERRHRP